MVQLWVRGAERRDGGRRVGIAASGTARGAPGTGVFEWRAGTRLLGRVPFAVQGAPGRFGSGCATYTPEARILMQVDRLGPSVRVLPPNHWTLLVQHPAGSIDAAVDAARRRSTEAPAPSNSRCRVAGSG